MPTHRVNVNFSQEAYATLERLAQERGKSMSEILRDAIGLEAWFHDATKRGDRVLLEQGRNGRVREIVPR